MELSLYVSLQVSLEKLFVFVDRSLIFDISAAAVFPLLYCFANEV